ncbi:hypothetical protein BUALT_Bualt11G0136500 [Buddleja alternifolia]|uniref:non-specific serine/threonine protein kinase n=1 Tax=Buddleja alternifolia TaxID=168488 RepID=A0AAV6X3F7_9LAMI|nr:hypothetical protein BUALT_Bualt11G0136500 [Buddleja alternifolia]
MVSSQLLSLRKNRTRKPVQQILLPLDPPDDVSSEQFEWDFSDVFGPTPVQASSEVGNGKSGEVNELVYDEPEVIYNRSHSLVGPSACVSQSLKLSGLTIDETEDPLQLVDSVINATDKEDHDASMNDTVPEGCGLLKINTMGLEDFEVLKVVRQGAFGKVYQVRKRGTSEIYAMKVMRKDKIMEKNHAVYMKAEREILTKIDHPFIVQLRYSFQTKYRLYLVLDFFNGGRLFFQLYHHDLFREDLARIYTAEIVSAVSHLHANGIMHRDLKPENILLDADGHAILTDFGLAKEVEENARSNSMCGTVEYMSPEIILGKGHDKAADWWSVGILLFEMLTGKLLQKEPSRRLGGGAKGSDEIKSHKWFKSINWNKLEAKGIVPSFRPEVAGDHCIANFDKEYTEMSASDSPVSSPKVEGNLFQGFTYVRPASYFLKRNNSPLCQDGFDA